MSVEYYICKECGEIMVDYGGAIQLDIPPLGRGRYCSGCFDALIENGDIWPDPQLLDYIKLKNDVTKTKEHFENFLDLQECLKNAEESRFSIAIHWENDEITRTNPKDLCEDVRQEVKDSMIRDFVPSLGYLEEKIGRLNQKIEKSQNKKRKMEGTLENYKKKPKT